MWSRIFWIMSGSMMSAMTRMVPPHNGHTEISILKTRLSRWAQVRGAINSSADSDFAIDVHSFWSSFDLGFLRFVGTMSFLIRAFGANTPWYRTRLCRGLGTRAASLLRKSRGENNMCVVPFLNGFFSSYWILPSALTMSLSRQIAGLVTYRHKRSNRSHY